MSASVIEAEVAGGDQAEPALPQGLELGPAKGARVLVELTGRELSLPERLDRSFQLPIAADPGKPGNRALDHGV
jgi:hypothetical protein